MSENNILRLAMVLEDNAATTLDKYICKLVEATLYFANEPSLDITSICSGISEQFNLTFDVGEVSNALKKKGSDRVVQQNGLYSISAKVANQLALQLDPMDTLKRYISEYAKISDTSFDEANFLECILKYLYHCFNSTKKNLLSLLQNIVLPVDETFFPSNDEITLINSFIAWENNGKNELFYKIIVSSYEYCMLTTKQDTLLSQRIFRGKRFFLDTNIIFRMAGINKDERKFVTDTFIKKSTEVGIDLCYTSETLSELFRVIDGQIKYIRYLTQGQAPVNSELIQKMNYEYEPNDFYVIYYNWSKEPSHNYRDFVSFQKYLMGLITSALKGLKMVSIENQRYSKQSDSYEKFCNGLRQFKNNKRPSKPISDESLQTDVNNILYMLSIRKTAQAQTIWQVNDFFVSADQLLTAWAEQTFPGIPIVVIPSTWLSIILRFSGRSSDDYKSYCLFMSLRQHRISGDDIVINPVLVMSTLSQKTSDVVIKEKIITELIANQVEYSFEKKEDYIPSIDRAFDKVVAELKAENENLIITAKTELIGEFQKEKDSFEKKLAERSSEQEYIMKYAQNKATRKIRKFKRIYWVQPILPFLGIAVVAFAITSYVLQWSPIYSVFVKLGSLAGTVLTIIMSVLPLALAGELKYLSSDERRENLVKKYRTEAEKNMKSE